MINTFMILVGRLNFLIEFYVHETFVVLMIISFLLSYYR